MMNRQKFVDSNLELLHLVTREFLLPLLLQELIVTGFRLLLCHEIAMSSSCGPLCAFHLNEDIDY